MSSLRGRGLVFGSLLNSIMTLILPDAWSLLKEEGDYQVIVSDRVEQFESWKASLHSIIHLKRGQKVLRAIRRFVQTFSHSEYEDIIDQICREVISTGV